MIRTEPRQGSGRDARAATEVGRVARLELRFAVRSGRTVLADAYAEPPFRVGRCFVEGDGLHMIMASSSPGIFGGDRFEQIIHVESGARVRLTSQSALQVHPNGSDEPATLRSRYVVEDGADLCCFWDPLIPFAGSRLDQRFEIETALGSRVSWSDAFMAGREARGERWQFAVLAHELRLTRAGTLTYLERYGIEPAKHSLSNRWISSDACYFGSMLTGGSGKNAAAAEQLHCALADMRGVSAAVDVIAEDMMLVRFMAGAGPPFHAARALAVSLR